MKLSDRKITFGLVIVAAILVSAVFIPNVLALGISPVQGFIDFEPGVKKELSFKIINNENRDLRLKVFARGENTGIVEIAEELIIIQHGEISKEEKVTFRLPETFEIPGSHTTEIVVTELEPLSDNSETSKVTAQASVVYKGIIRVPYPGKYAEAKLQVVPGNINETSRFVVLLFNLGNEPIESAYADVVINGAGRIIKELKTDSLAILPKKNAKLETLWGTDALPGIYTADVKVDYDGNIIELSNDFEVGNLLVEIEKIDVLDFSLGDVARFDLYLKSFWNQDLSDVYAQIFFSKDGEKKGDFKTSTVNLKPLKSEKLRAYWDTAGIDIGEYDMNIVIYYGGRTTEKKIKATVGLDSIRTSLSATGRAISGKSGLFGGNTLIIVIVVLVLINAGWFIYFIKSKNKSDVKSSGKLKEKTKFKKKKK